MKLSLVFWSVLLFSIDLLVAAVLVTV